MTSPQSGGKPNVRVTVSWVLLALATIASGVASPLTASAASSGRVSTASVRTVVRGGWELTGRMRFGRYQHTATLLRNGKVLVVGGCIDPNCTDTTTAELYDPATGTWERTGNMHVARNAPSATLLPSGRVLVAGGNNRPTGTVNHVVASCELYDPKTGTWSFTGTMHVARNDHPATLLPDGRVLVSGGDDETRDFTSAELYDPKTGTWTNTGSMHNVRTGHTQTLLGNGKVLVAGGLDIATFNGLSSAELYDPKTGTWSKTGSLHTARGGQVAGLLTRGPSKGDVLIAGGVDASSPSFAVSSAELYDPSSASFGNAATMSTGHGFAAATMLPDGNLMAIGGVFDAFFDTTSSVEVYNAKSQIWMNAAAMNIARAGHVAVSLPDKSVLVSGGFCAEQNGIVNCGSPTGVLPSAEVLDGADEM